MKKKRERKRQLFVIPWAVAYQAPLSMEFSRQEYWSGLPFPSPGDLPEPDILTSEPPRRPQRTTEEEEMYMAYTAIKGKYL